MKILITGISGLLGAELAKTLCKNHEVAGLTKSSAFQYENIHNYNADICDRGAIYILITKINPDLVVHTAAISDVDKCEKEPELAYRVNALGTRNIALACQRFDTILLYISTDYAFSGADKNRVSNPNPYPGTAEQSAAFPGSGFGMSSCNIHPQYGYTELDPVEPVNIYAKSKLWGEWYVRHLLNRFFIVRTAWLFGQSKMNYVSRAVDSLKQGKPVKAATDMVSSPTYVKDLSYGISELIECNSYGLYHLTNTGVVSRYEIANRVADIMKADKSLIHKVTRADLGLAAARPSFSALDNYAWRLEGFEPLRPWQEAVEEFIIECK